MASYKHSLSPLFQRFVQPVIEDYPHSSKPYDCQELTDLIRFAHPAGCLRQSISAQLRLDFIEMGVKRCGSASGTGRDFLQHHGYNGRKEVSNPLPPRAFGGLGADV